MGNGFGPTAVACADGTFTDFSKLVPDANPNNPSHCNTVTGPSFTGGPLIFYLQDGVPTGLINIKPGASSINNQDYALFAQDKWQILPNLSLSYGLRWEAEIFPNVITPPNKTAYGIFLRQPAVSIGWNASQPEEGVPTESRLRMGCAEQP